ncbi:DNA-directed RNA polymerase subunit omega [Wukongibacter baidiensis]|uniref:DNA-directed RNA polymerase subunit omega n=1 Tax=Wukongibacter baidiensis TaxID=1723361 RepID=UPI003D7FB9C7
MLKPPINDLLEKVDSRYTLVIAAAKRARQIIDGNEKLIDIDSNKPVTIATNELFEDKIGYEKIETETEE